MPSAIIATVRIVSPSNASFDVGYADLKEEDIPLAECLKDTVERFLPYWHETIAPTVSKGKKALIAAHGNSLRALVMYLDNISKEEIVSLNIPTGIPLVYELDSDLRPIKHYYLGDPEAAKTVFIGRAHLYEGRIHGPRACF